MVSAKGNFFVEVASKDTIIIAQSRFRSPCVV